MLANAGLVVAVDVRAHCDLALLLRIGQNPPDVLGVLESVLAAADGAAYRASLHPPALQVLLHAYEHLRRRAHEKLVLPKVDVKPVRRRVPLLQAAEDLAGWRFAWLSERLGQHRLEEVSTGEFFFRPVDEFSELARLELAPLDTFGHLRARLEGHLCLAAIDALRASHADAVAEDEVVAHSPCLLGLVVDHEDVVGDVEYKVALFGIALLVQLHRLELERQVVAKRPVEPKVRVFIGFEQLGNRTNNRENARLFRALLLREEAFGHFHLAIDAVDAHRAAGDGWGILHHPHHRRKKGHAPSIQGFDPEPARPRLQRDRRVAEPNGPLRIPARVLVRRRQQHAPAFVQAPGELLHLLLGLRDVLDLGNHHDLAVCHERRPHWPRTRGPHRGLAVLRTVPGLRALRGLLLCASLHGARS
mmetsp:Transcript_32276/g.89142  ORF Transcript_32276/g.89142 Transcript_32276/m.89142 type:complete len:418 (-) Transcript_32276:92-1345(-)